MKIHATAIPQDIVDTMSNVDLFLGDWRSCDVIGQSMISDPPFGSRTHEGWNNGSMQAINGHSNELDYEHWTPDHVHEFVDYWSPRIEGWMNCQTSHDLIPAWEDAFRRNGRYGFAPLPLFPPIPFIDMGKDPRIVGDGPASWTCYCMAARPKSSAWLKDWRRRRKALGLSRSLPGAYVRAQGDVIWKPPGKGRRIGGKPPGFIRALVLDYSLPGDLVIDPCAGHATLLRACQELGDRDAIGCERDRDVWETAMWRLQQPVQTVITKTVRQPEPVQTLLELAT